uniref:Uncharacterized protein n=1 Tax=Acrobeloides nanus TaxID=290746 RepID=A0A914CRP4_9BILA
MKLLDFLIFHGQLLGMMLSDKACAKPHPSVESFDQSLDEITLETLKKIVDNFPKRMKACVEAKGGHC